MAGTTAAAFKGALTTALETLAAAPASALYRVQVQYADNPKTAKTERIYLGNVEDGEHEPAALRAGRRRRDETYNVHVFIETIGQRKTAQDNEERAVDLVTALEEHLADNPKLHASIAWAVVSGLEMTTTETSDGPRTVVDVTVTVKARLL